MLGVEGAGQQRSSRKDKELGGLYEERPATLTVSLASVEGNN